MTTMKSHGATPAMPNVRSNSMPGKPIQNSSETNEIAVTASDDTPCGYTTARKPHGHGRVAKDERGRDRGEGREERDDELRAEAASREPAGQEQERDRIALDRARPERRVEEVGHAVEGARGQGGEPAEKVGV